MTVKILFEDKYDLKNLDLTTPSSILLKSGINGKNIYFSNGNNLLKSKLDEIYNKDDLFVVFIDVVPNNAALITLYRNLVSQIESDDMDDNVVVLPIPCIEYYIIDMLTELDIIFVKNKNISDLYNHLYLELDWKNIPFEKKTVSMEKLYKEIVNLQKPYCLRNRNKDDSSYYGDFYRISCEKCTDRHCMKYFGYSKEFKAEFLYTRLPYFYVVNEYHLEQLKKLQINMEEHSIREAKENLQNFYQKLCAGAGKIMVTVL